jgi:hypothetical protein
LCTFVDGFVFELIANAYGNLVTQLVDIVWGNKQKFTNFAIASKAFKDRRKMDLGALAWVELSNKIMIEGECPSNNKCL